MRKISLFLSIAFLVILLLVYNTPYKTYQKDEIKLLKENTKVTITGKVIDEIDFGKRNLLILDNGLKVISSNSFYNKNIEVKGKLTNYKKENLIQAHKITILN